MPSRSSIKTPKNQQGLALLILIIVIVLAFATYSLSGLSINQVKTENKLQTRLALKKAKDALMSFLVVRSELFPPMVLSAQPSRYGYLPCPANYNGDGNSVGTCESLGENALGWLPWRSLHIEPLKDGNGDCLLYAVSSTYKFYPAANFLNQDSYGMFRIRDQTGAITQGVLAQDRVVAIIFSSGKALPGQSRFNDQASECNNDPNNFSAYLDSFEVTPGDVIDNSQVDTVNANQIDEFIHVTTNSENSADPYNDIFVTITRDEIRDALFSYPNSSFVAKMENLTQALAECIKNYANDTLNTSRRLPWPVLSNLGGGDYTNKDDYDDYDLANNLATSDGYSGRFPFDVTNSNGAIGGFTLTELFSAPATTNCSAIAVGTGTTSDTVDLTDADSEYRKLWHHWKDHFFYIVSKPYEPANMGVVECGASDCIQVNGVQYAGAVIFSGKRLDGVVRDDKSVISDYLEDGKAAVFTTEAINKTGSESYDYTIPQTDNINDIMYCIQDQAVGNPLVVAECS